MAFAQMSVKLMSKSIHQRADIVGMVRLFLTMLLLIRQLMVVPNNKLLLKSMRLRLLR
jgi:hypothetical protein